MTSEESTTPDLVELLRDAFEAVNRRAYEEWQAKPEELLDLGSGVVLAVVRQSGRPVGTVGHVQQREGWVFVWVDGLIVHVTAHTDIDEGRAAAERLAESRG